MPIHPWRIPVCAFILSGFVAAAHADVILYVNDTSANIGQVDISTQSVVPGSVHNTGLPASNSTALSDIAFNSSGTLFGSTFASLYTVNPNNGALTLVGSFGSVGANGMNALVGSGSTTLLGASSTTSGVFSIDSTTATGTPFAPTPVVSAGDLAFSGTTLFESGTAASGNDELINVSTGNVVGLFQVSMTGGAQLNDVLGLADDGTTLYALAGTEVYAVNSSDAILTPLFDYSLAENGQDLSQARGAAFIDEGPVTPISPIPEPASLLLIGGGLAAVALSRRSRQS